jgi:hypothetical protein
VKVLKSERHRLDSLPGELDLVVDPLCSRNNVGSMIEKIGNFWKTLTCDKLGQSWR